MGKKALEVKKVTVRRIRATRLTEAERQAMRTGAAYEGSAHHKRNRGDFGLTPPAAPRPDKTLCDEAGILERDVARRLFERAIDRGLVSEPTATNGMPKQLWVVDEQGRVFEAMYGGSVAGRYHGYPIRRADPLFGKITRAWVEQP